MSEGVAAIAACKTSISEYVATKNAWPSDTATSGCSTLATQYVASLTVSGNPGFNRVSWDLRPSKDLLTEYGGEGRKFVRSGDYKVTLNYGKLKKEQPLTVTVAPGIETR